MRSKVCMHIKPQQQHHIFSLLILGPSQWTYGYHIGGSVFVLTPFSSALCYYLGRKHDSYLVHYLKIPHIMVTPVSSALSYYLGRKDDLYLLHCLIKPPIMVTPVL